MTSAELGETLKEEWINFFYERLDLISDSELEHANSEIVGFSWPGEVRALVENPVEAFRGSLGGVSRLRNEIFLLNYTQ